MIDDPKPFSDSQRELFAQVSKMNRRRAADFAEADEWLNTDPPSAGAEYRRFRNLQLARARERRQLRDRSANIELARPEKGRGIVTYQRHFWETLPRERQQEILHEARNHAGRELTFQRREFARRMTEENARGPLRPHELIHLAAARLLGGNPPLAFDAMNPTQKSLWAHRLLRVVWILTDTAKLETTKLKWLREWDWGEHALEFLEPLLNADGKPIPRLWLRVTTFDRQIDEWERLTRLALGALEEAEFGAASGTDPPANAARKSNKRNKRKQTRRPTPRQLEAVQLFGELKGNKAAAAKQLGISRAAYNQRLEAGFKNSGAPASMMNPKTKSYGEVHVAGDDDGPAIPTLGPAREKVNRRRR